MAASDSLAAVREIILRNSTPRILRAFLEFTHERAHQLFDAKKCGACAFVRGLAKQLDLIERGKWGG